MTVYPIQSSFTRGELAPRLHGRVDIDHYRLGLASCENFLVLKQGGIIRRSGSKFVAEVKNSSALTRLIPFAFNETQAYAIEMGNLYVRFFALDGQVMSGGSPYEVTSPFTTAQAFEVDYAQSADVLYLTHEDHWIRTLTRSAETSWAFATFDFEDGPYLDVNTTTTTLTPAGTGHATVDHTANNTASNIVSSSNGTDSWRIFDREKASYGVIDTGSSGWVKYQFASSAQKVVDAYWLTAPANNAQNGDMPSAWSLQGSNDDSTWVTLDSRDGETTWAGSETRFFEFVNEAAFEYYRLSCSGGGGSDGTTTAIGELALHQKASDQTAFNLTASSTTGINDGDGFQSDDAGRHIRLLGSDNVYRWAEIVSVSSTTVVTIRLHGHALPDTSPIVFWAMGAWGNENGWPSHVGFYEERLAFGRTPMQPRTVWLSKSLDYNDFGTSTPLEATDGINITMTGAQLNGISMLEEGPDLIVGTAGAIRTIGQATASEPFSATNAKQSRQTTVGAASMKPAVIGNVMVYSGFHKTGLYEYGYDYEVNGGVAQELTILSDHAFKLGISAVVYQEFPNSVIWAVRTDGQFISTTYEREQQVVGVARQKIAGGSADDFGIVESACVVPIENGDRVWMIVRRTIDGNTVRYVEYMDDIFDTESGQTIEDGVFFDSAVTVTGTAMTSISGADHLEGETVGILADGVDIGDATVSSGSFDLPNDVEADTVTYGLRYESYAETLRMPQAGNRDGTALGRLKKAVSISLDLLDTAYIKAGTLTKQFEYLFRSTSESMDTAPDLYTGVKKLSAEGSWSNEGVAVMRTDKGYPATIRALIVGIEGEP